MQLFYAPDIVPPEYTLSEEESKHCIRVLRMACGEELHITDGAVTSTAVKSWTTIPNAAGCGCATPTANSASCPTA